MSQDHISDSENDENQDTLIIDKKLLSNQLLQLTPTKRGDAETTTRVD